MLPPKAVHELKKIIQRDYGVVISDDQAQELGVSLLGLTRVSLAVLIRSKKITSQPEKENEDKIHTGDIHSGTE